MKNCLIAAAALAAATGFSYAKTHFANPGNFKEVFGQVNNGDTVKLADGTYRLSDGDVRNFTRRANVTYVGNKWRTNFENTSGAVKKIQFNGKPGLVLRGITFRNFDIVLRNCQDHVFDWNRILNNKRRPGGGEVYLAFYNAGGLYQWSNVRQDYNNGFSSKGVKYNQHSRYLVRTSSADGRLRGAFDLSDGKEVRCEDNKGSLTSGGTVKAQDHAVYHHDVNGLYHARNTMTGWSDSSSGGSVKIKNVRRAELYKNNMFTSGVLGRVEPVSDSEFQDVWIHNNTVHGGDIDIWTPNYNPTQIRLNNNNVKKGRISAFRDINSRFNWRTSFGNREGGVYNNSAKSYRLAGPIKKSGNKTL